MTKIENFKSWLKAAYFLPAKRKQELLGILPILNDGQISRLGNLFETNKEFTKKALKQIFEKKGSDLFFDTSKKILDGALMKLRMAENKIAMADAVGKRKSI